MARVYDEVMECLENGEWWTVHNLAEEIEKRRRDKIIEFSFLQKVAFWIFPNWLVDYFIFVPPLAVIHSVIYDMKDEQLLAERRAQTSYKSDPYKYPREYRLDPNIRKKRIQETYSEKLVLKIA